MNTLTLVTLLFFIITQIELVAILWLLKRPHVKLNKLQHPVFLDTSVLMDGRIEAIAKSGFLPSPLIIPRSVIAEMQLLADGSDNDKRARARYGLDVARSLQDQKGIDVIVYADGDARQGVDERLLELARAQDGRICTLDYNLGKVAALDDIAILNINELAQEIRMNHLPGEIVSLLIQQKGSDARQGVGYFDDGTMVVVEDGGSMIGQQVNVVIVRSLQTVAGRMVFARKQNVTRTAPRRNSKKQSPRQKKQTAEDRIIALTRDNTK